MNKDVIKTGFITFVKRLVPLFTTLIGAILGGLLDTDIPVALGSAVGVLSTIQNT